VEGSLQHIINSTMLLMIAATFFSGKPVPNAPKFTLVRILFVNVSQKLFELYHHCIKH
jgi:hypothetical protein